MPEPTGLRKCLGASVILITTALGSDELILWPYLTSQVGAGIVWLAVLEVSMQFFSNMEIECHTPVTGETGVTGFSRSRLLWG